MNSLLPRRRRCGVTHIFIGIKSRQSGHPRDHESGEQGGISFKKYGLYHVTKIIETVTTPPYWCSKSVHKTEAPLACRMVLCMIVLTEVGAIKEFTSQESLLQLQIKVKKRKICLEKGDHAGFRLLVETILQATFWRMAMFFLLRPPKTGIDLTLTGFQHCVQGTLRKKQAPKTWSKQQNKARVRDLEQIKKTRKRAKGKRA